MIGASSTGGSFRTLGGYLVQKDEGRVGWVETRNLEGRDVDQVVTEMEEWAGQNARVRRPVYHVIVAFDPDDHPTEAELRSAAGRTLRDLGLDGHQALIVHHNDSAHEHVHLMVNRVGPDGKAWSKSNDHRKIRASMEAQERDLGVRWTGQNAERIARASRAFERAGDRATVRELIGQEPEPTGRARDRGFAAEIRGSSLDDFKGASNWRDLDARLAARGLSVERRGQGAVVTDGAREAKLSSVSRAVSRGKLEARWGPMPHRAPARERALARERSQGAGRRVAPARSVAAAPSRAGAEAAGPLLSRRRAAAAVGTVGRRLRLQPVSIRGAAGRAMRGGEEQDPEVRALRKLGRVAAGAVRVSLAGRRAAATRSPAAPSRPERMTEGRLRGLVRARQTARVERVVALVGRVHAHERAAGMLGVTTRYQGRVEGTVALARQAGEKAQALEAHLKGVYERPAEARAQILGYAQKAGPERASEVLAREPERFGKTVATPAPPAPSRLGKLFSKPSPGPDPAAAVARRAEEAGPLVASAHRARSQAAEAVRSLGVSGGSSGSVKGPELAQAVERRASRLKTSGELGRSRVPGSRAASEQLSRAVQGLTPGQQAQVASRVGKAGLGTVSRSVSAAKALVRGVER